MPSKLLTIAAAVALAMLASLAFAAESEDRARRGALAWF